MTDLLAEYLKHRAQGHGHHAALKALARRFDLDEATVARVIDRAHRDLDRDTQRGRVKKPHDPATTPRPSPARALASDRPTGSRHAA